jgi:hypothetical protein
MTNKNKEYIFFTVEENHQFSENVTVFSLAVAPVGSQFAQSGMR